MITRRNWLLKCSILINVAVLLYICSHMMIGSSNIQLGPAFIIQEDVPKSHLRQQENEIFQTNEKDSSIKTQETSQILSEQPKENVFQPEFIEPLPLKESVESIVVESNAGGVAPVEEKRFEMPTEATNSIPLSSKNEVVYQEVNMVNTSYGEGVSTDGMLDLESRLKTLVHCHNKDYDATIGQRGDFWVIRNYIKAEHGELRCLETVTYTTHADYTFLDNLIPLLERWMAPISIALHAPGTDFNPTVNSIKFLRDCLPESHLVRQFVTFHIYFSSKHIPKNVPKHSKVLEQSYNCSIPPPFSNITAGQLYKTQKKLLYPVNVGRNVARDAAMTNFILASDIELYPNPGLARKFLEMTARNDLPLQRPNPRVFPLSIFEVDASSIVPRDKTELQELLRTGKAIPFHKRVCPSCHGVPMSKEWMAANETDEMGISHIGKRVGYFVHWEPIYIGTHNDPHYDERLSWEGKSDKMTQAYALCVLDYDFQILDNAFLVHKPGIKVLKKDTKRAMLAAKTNQLIKKIIWPELQVMYGVKKGCAV